MLSFILTAYAQEDSAEPIDGFIGDPKVDSFLSNILTDIISPSSRLGDCFRSCLVHVRCSQVHNVKRQESRQDGAWQETSSVGGVGLFIITSLWGIMGFLADMTNSNVWFR